MGDNKEQTYSNLFNDILSQDNSDHYNLLYKAIKENEAFGDQKENNVQEIVSQIHTLLSVTKSKLEGLVLLHEIVQQCTTEIFSKNSPTWLKLLTTILQGYSAVMVKDVACLVIGNILKHASGFPELCRDFSTVLLPPLISILLNAKPEWINAAMKCLRMCVTYFPGACGNVKNKMKALATPFLSGLHEEHSQSASLLFAKLAICGGGGHGGVKHAEAWAELTDLLLGTMIKTLNELYEDHETDSITHREFTVHLQFPDAGTTEPQRSLLLIKRLEVLTRTLCHVIRFEFHVSVKIPLTDIITYICRVLGLSQKQLFSQHQREKQILAAHIPAIHLPALKLLQVMILSCSSHFVSSHQVINKVLLECLEVTKLPPTAHGTSKSLCGLRSEVYATFKLWMHTLGVSSGIENISSKLIFHLLTDATPIIDKLKSQVSKSDSALAPHRGKKKKKGRGQVDTGQLIAYRKINPTANSATTSAALSVLELLLTKIGPFIKPQDQKKIQELMMKACFEVHSGECQPPVPYSDVECRLALYKVVMATVSSPCGQWPPPTQTAICVFRQGFQDNNQEVSEYCSYALAKCEILIHSRVPILGVPVSAQIEQNNQEDISDKTVEEFIQEEHSVISRENTESSLPQKKVSEDENAPTLSKVLPVEHSSDENVITVDSDANSEDSNEVHIIESDVAETSMIVEPVQIEPVNSNKKEPEKKADAWDSSASDIFDQEHSSSETKVEKRKLSQDTSDSVEQQAKKIMIQNESDDEVVADMLKDFVEADPDSD